MELIALVWLCVTAPVAKFMELELPPLEFRPWFLLFGVGNFIVCMLLEKLITGNETIRLRHENKMKNCCKHVNYGQYISCVCHISSSKD